MIRDLTGETFGRWLVLAYDRKEYKRYKNSRKGTTQHYWRAQCECGRIVSVYHGSLLAGLSTQCRTCSSGEQHGLSRGEGRHPMYGAWATMKNRCSNPKHPDYPLYGARGIRVCPRWRKSFTTFLSDMGERPKGLTLDRIDNEENYEPGNCRWATHSEQMSNRRKWAASQR